MSTCEHFRRKGLAVKEIQKGRKRELKQEEQKGEDKNGRYIL